MPALPRSRRRCPPQSERERAPRLRLVHRRGSPIGPRLRPRQRHVRRSSTCPRSWPPASRSSTTTTTATSTCIWCRASRSRPLPRPARPRSRGRSAVPQRPGGCSRMARAPAIHRRHGRRAASRPAATAWASPRATSTTTAGVDLYLTQVQRAEPAAAQQRRRHLQRMSSRRAGTNHRVLERVGRVRGHRSRRLARSLRRQLPALQRSRATRRAPAPRARRTTARPTATSRCPAGCIATSGTAPSPTSASPSRHRAASTGPASDVSTADFDGDGWIDIYVANDGKENQLWMNRRDGTFENAALLSGRGAAR